MTRILRFSVLPLLCCAIAPSLRSQIPTAETEYENGMVARQKIDLDGALSHLQRAVDLDPSMIRAHFALGLTAQDLSGPQSSPRRDMGAIAIREYKKVLELNASHAEAAMNLAYLLYSFGDLAESERYYRKALDFRQDDAEAACGVAALDAKRGWSDVAETRNNLKLSSEKLLIDSPSCRNVRDRNLMRFEEGIALLTRAREAAPDNVELVGFLNMLYRGRAQIQCGNRSVYEADEDIARKWDRMEKEMLKKREPGHAFPRCPPAPPPMPDR